MQQKRLNLERPIKFENFKPVIGTVNRKCPTSFYVAGKTYITPCNDEDDYHETMKKMESSIKANLKRFLTSNEVLGRDFILNFEVSENGLKYGKNSYLFFQMFFTQRKFNTLPEIITFMEPSVSKILTEMKQSIETGGFRIVSNGSRKSIYK